MSDKKLRVVELLAGVGGFRLGLQKNKYKVVWSNQWEPSTKMQHASHESTLIAYEYPDHTRRYPPSQI